ncbi:MAG TPA: hypothetical protein VME42_08010 [Steroidobacteraceae bacterium]|nr:hypothetical protein [Steroidobacteraceae bacterium]
MSELDRALAEIRHIRCQVARGTQFRGYGPASIAASGVLALMVAAAQSHWMRNQADFYSFAAAWIAVAFVSLAMAVAEMTFRARRVHCGLAMEMIQSAAEQFLPSLVVGGLLTALLLRAAPKEDWMLPGLWQLLFSLGVFASCRFLPRWMFAVGVWYLVAGLATLMIQSGSQSMIPWTMGIAFGVGQLLVAAVLYCCLEGNSEEA